MIKAVAATPLTRAELTALIGEHDENTLVELGKYIAKIKPYPADSTLAVVDTVKEGGRLWGIRPAQRDIDGCDYIAFLAKDWYVELMMFDKPRKHAEYIEHMGCYRVYDDSNPNSTIGYADKLADLKDHDINEYTLDILDLKENTNADTKDL